jgi:hypothetical protein
MPCKITRRGTFAIRSFQIGHSACPAHDAVLQLEQVFHINPNGIRFFWPDDEIDMIIAVMPDRSTRRKHPALIVIRASMTKT